MSVRILRLRDELHAAGHAVEVGLAPALPPNYDTAFTNATWHDRPDCWVRLTWPSEPTTQQEAAADVVIQAHVGNPTVSEILQDYPMTPKVLAAMCIRGSTHWPGLDSDRKARVAAIIDAHAQSLINAVGWGD